MFATVSFVYSSSAHVLCLLKYLDLSVFHPVSISMLLFPLLVSLRDVWDGSPVLAVTLCLAVIWGLFVYFFFCLDYYGMQLAAEPLPVYCPHPGPGIITDITRLFTLWEPR